MSQKFEPVLSKAQEAYNHYVDWFRELLPDAEPAEFELYERIVRPKG